MKNMIPNQIKKLVGSGAFTIDEIGMSDSQVFCYEDMVLKVQPHSKESQREYHILNWLQGILPVPNILHYEIVQSTTYLLMSKLTGKMACDDYYLQKPNELIHLLACGLKMLWSIDITNCPYNNHLDIKLENAKYRIENDLCSIEDVEPNTYGENGFEDPEDLLLWLTKNKPTEDFVFSHGDYCLPNLFFKNSDIDGFIDFGRGGIADKWQDIALCVRSIQHNLGKNQDYIDQLFLELNMNPNWDKIKYYILLDELF